MEELNILSDLPGLLLPWYEENKRALPWRKDREPYHIWLSEIMLQQTRVEVVKGYYARFLNALPTVEALSQADDDLLNKLWEGLGYYSRVRNLKKAAVRIMEDHGGMFPTRYEEILALPGIGEYTAGAICSIAYEQPVPAVDGNVLRLMTRLLDDCTPVEAPVLKKRIRMQLEQVYPAQAGAFTQALMELGATLCGPNGKPNCEACPCKAVCVGRRNGTAELLPVRQVRKPRRVEKKTVLILRSGGCYALKKRPSTGLLASMWQFPDVSGWLTAEETVSKVEEMGIKVRDISLKVEREHIFTHVEWAMRGYYMEVVGEGGGFRWRSLDQISREDALPTAYRQFLEGIE